VQHKHYLWLPELGRTSIIRLPSGCYCCCPSLIFLHLPLAREAILRGGC